MERLLFGSMQAGYRIESKYIIDSEENDCSTYSSKLQVSAQYEKEKDNYTFILNRSEALLNGKPAGKLMDRIMCEAGSSLYPLHLRVSPHLWILDVLNFNEIKQRWQQCAGDWMAKAPSPELERYFRFSEKNLANSKTLITSLYRDTFCNLYFRDIFTPTGDDEVRLIRWQNFPEREMDQSYLYQIKPEEANRIRLSGEIMKIVPEHNGTFDTVYETGDQGEIQRIKGQIESEWEGTLYMKQWTLETETGQIAKQGYKSLILDE